MSAIGDARTALANAVSSATAFTVKPRPISIPSPMSGWVIVRSITPAQFFSRIEVQFQVILVSGSDRSRAEDVLDEQSVNVMNAISDSFNVSSISTEPTEFVTENDGSVFALVINITMEVG